VFFAPVSALIRLTTSDRGDGAGLTMRLITLLPLLQTKRGLNRTVKKATSGSFQLFVHAYKQYRQLHVLWK